MERKVTTVTTVLYNGNYDGPQMSISDISGCQMFVIARDDLNFISSHDEMKKPAFYVLIGSKKGLPTAYIGQTDDFYVETLGLSTVFLEEFCTESLTVSMS